MDFYYSKGLPGNAASRSLLNRPSASIRLVFFKLLVLFPAGIVIFPPGLGAAPSSRESNSSELLTLIALPVFFPLVVLRSLPPPLAEDVPPVLDRVGDLTVVLFVVVLVVAVVGASGGSPNGGALESG